MFDVLSHRTYRRLFSAQLIALLSTGVITEHRKLRVPRLEMSGSATHRERSVSILERQS